MKTLQDIKNYMADRGIDFPGGDTTSPEGIQRQFDTATSFPFSVYYIAYDNKNALVIHRAVVDSTGKIISHGVLPADIIRERQIARDNFDRAMDGLF